MNYSYKVITKTNREYIIITDKEMNEFIRKVFGDNTKCLTISTWDVKENGEFTGVILLNSEISSIELMLDNIN